MVVLTLENITRPDTHSQLSRVCVCVSVLTSSVSCRSWPSSSGRETSLLLQAIRTFNGRLHTGLGRVDNWFRLKSGWKKNRPTGERAERKCKRGFWLKLSRFMSIQIVVTDVFLSVLARLQMLIIIKQSYNVPMMFLTFFCYCLGTLPTKQVDVTDQKSFKPVNQICCDVSLCPKQIALILV